MTKMIDFLKTSLPADIKIGDEFTFKKIKTIVNETCGWENLKIKIDGVEAYLNFKVNGNYYVKWKGCEDGWDYDDVTIQVAITKKPL